MAEAQPVPDIAAFQASAESLGPKEGGLDVGIAMLPIRKGAHVLPSILIS